LVKIIIQTITQKDHENPVKAESYFRQRFFLFLQKSPHLAPIHLYEVHACRQACHINLYFFSVVVMGEYFLTEEVGDGNFVD